MKGESSDSIFKRLLRQCAPQVRRYWLVLVAGLLWLFVGIALMVVACWWLSRIFWLRGVAVAAFSLCAGLVIHLYGFSRIVRKNIARIAMQAETVCVFAFQGWRSYFLILLMMFFGYAVRHLPIPKYVDAVIYFSMGAALAFSSSLYFQEFSRQ